jgi:hypothetical protein
MPEQGTTLNSSEGGEASGEPTSAENLEVVAQTSYIISSNTASGSNL